MSALVPKSSLLLVPVALQKVSLLTYAVPSPMSSQSASSVVPTSDGCTTFTGVRSQFGGEFCADSRWNLKTHHQIVPNTSSDATTSWN